MPGFYILALATKGERLAVVGAWYVRPDAGGVEASDMVRRTACGAGRHVGNGVSDGGADGQRRGSRSRPWLVELISDPAN